MLRKRGRKMTQAELGKAVGFTPAVIGFYESETNEPNYDTWRKLAKALLTTPGELMFGNSADVPIEENAEQPSERPTRKRKRSGG